MTAPPPPPGYQTGDNTLQRALTMTKFTPQAHALGIELTRIEPPKVWGHVPYRADLVGDPDTGVIAGGPVRAVITAAGIPNVLTKSIGTHNPHNVVKATIAALEQLRDKAEVAEMRGISIDKL